MAKRKLGATKVHTSKFNSKKVVITPKKNGTDILKKYKVMSKKQKIKKK